MERAVIRRSLERAFPAADAGTISVLAAEARTVSLRRAEVLYREGDVARSMHVVLSGRLQVRASNTLGGERVVAFLGEGEVVGEMALLVGGRRTATVAAARDSVLAEFDQDVFAQAAARQPQVIVEVARRVIDRLLLTQRGETIALPLKHLALVPIGASAAVHEVARCLELALLRFGRVCVIDGTSAARVADHRSNDSQGAVLALTKWIDDLERGYDFVVSVTDEAATPWTRLCSGHADKLLLVAGAGERPELTELEEELERHLGQHAGETELVLIHRGGSPNGTKRWLDPRQIARHHHAPWAGNSGFDRLARRLAGKEITLVLSGGGARGLAHVGVVRALREAEVPVDAVGGVSFGSLVGAAVALNVSNEAMLEQSRSVFLEGGLLNDYTVPMVSLLRGRQMEELLRQTFDDADIADAWIPFFALSANLSRSRLEIHTRGTFWRALRASVSLPGVFPPLPDRGDLLVDGGLLNNFPVDIMKELFPGRTVAVDLSQGDDRIFGEERVPTPLEILVQKLRRKGSWFPSLLYVLMKSTTLSSSGLAASARNLADLCLCPPVERYDMLDFSRLYDLVDAGYRYTQKRLREWLETRPDWIAPMEVFDSRVFSRWEGRAGAC